ncbi:MAG: hypothetical protein IT437_05300 [Phycisphaerales bacterium]|nr:hypothetical protein [Phycisphaerales bacterium]
MLRIVQVVHVVAAGVWLGALVMRGVQAALVFRTMRSIRPTLPDFAAYPGEHWRLAGGMLTSRLFVASDVVQFVCLMACGVTFTIAVLGLGLPVRRASCSVGGAVIIALVAVLSYQFFVLTPNLTEHMQAYWDAARAGSIAAADSHRAAVDALHPTARALMTTDAALVLVLLVAGAWSMTPPRAGPELQEPGLMGRGR